MIASYDSPDAFHFVDPPYVNSDRGHYEDTFNERHMEDLLRLLEPVNGRFMLTMSPFNMIDRYTQCNGWIIHCIERTINASKSSRRQEEWMVCNCEEGAEATLFQYAVLIKISFDRRLIAVRTMFLVNLLKRTDIKRKDCRYSDCALIRLVI